MKGIVRCYNFRRGRGFISGDGDRDVFFKQVDIPMDIAIERGDRVEFDCQNTEQGLQAKNLRKLCG
jgi:cold shock CspA family protein